MPRPHLASGLYECTIVHARLAPRPHRFRYRIFLFALDLDELPAIARRTGPFSLGRPNLYSFRDADFMPTGAPGTLKERVLHFLAERGVDLPGGRVLLVTLPRVLGFLFNPVSFYFCCDRHGTPTAAIAEVTNTFREVKPFLLGPAAHSAAGVFHLRVPKHFYVSPFSDVDVAFDFKLRAPGERLAVQIDDYTGPQRTLTSVLAGTRRELTSARLLWFAVKYPLLTLRIISLIHWHAFRLWLKRVPWFPKSARAADQRALYRPHASIASDPA